MAVVSEGHGGWFSQSTNQTAPTVWFRLERTSTGRAVVVELYVQASGLDHPMTSDALRSISIPSLEAYVNSNPDLLELIGKDRDRVNAATDRWLEAVGTRGPWRDIGAKIRRTAPAQRARALTLKVPPGRPKPDQFYRQVAAAYATLAVESPRPAAELAERNGVPVSSVHGWIKEARRRGFLPPGAVGKRG